MRENNCLELVEIFSSASGSVYQCNKTNCYILEYSGIATSFKTANFLDFVKQVKSIDIEKMIFSNSAVTDVAILMPPYCDRCFVLTLQDLLNLKELLYGAKFNLQLNSVLNTCLQPSF